MSLENRANSFSGIYMFLSIIVLNVKKSILVFTYT